MLHFSHLWNCVQKYALLKTVCFLCFGHFSNHALLQRFLWVFVWFEHMVCVFLIAFPLFWGWFAMYYTDFWEEAG